ncbi:MULTISPECIES: hypothetical protein [unclassified Paenibacillus]|uniref:hypothetical protein n=1 Tax=unclassified Paenibacillus TaxID=185978 RepID=UPI000CFE3236|nr:MULTISPECIES: hypothetical protein [unclassified Paenibacillus]MBD8840396.1 hypothetical protein [Paenibacillus sp. CFBP 13594]PRA09015.1 hypothetical protein CQ043_03265 [Paenibacillus sp. MYb63]PRA48949.1 hypothetical protein CQ061_11720 [Paenibacillus sp. MYb67]QZN73244.1 hypothetical protein K5K90_17420 [Paenibacillus sp. DR312]
MRLSKVLMLTACSFILTTSISSGGVSAATIQPNTSTSVSDVVTPMLESKPFTVVHYYPVGFGVPKYLTDYKTPDGYVGTLVLVSYHTVDGIVAARYDGTVYR